METPSSAVTLVLPIAYTFDKSRVSSIAIKQFSATVFCHR
jgi:hypothetical protein